MGKWSDEFDQVWQFLRTGIEFPLDGRHPLDEKVIKSYDATLKQKPEWSDRTSYVIAPDGTILLAYTNLDPSQHVAMTMAAVKKWKDEHK